MPHEDHQPADSPRADPTRPIHQQAPEQFGAEHRPAPHAQFRQAQPGVGPMSPLAASEADTEGTSPALRRPRWSGKKTAVVAAVAIGLSSAGAIGAAAASPAGQSGGGGFGQNAPGRFGGAGTQRGTGTQSGTGTGAQGSAGTEGGTGAQVGPGGSGLSVPPGAGTRGQGTTSSQGTTNGTTT
ncbi:hypothetical protein [Allobranchiibius sp. CTAmp26]|uniref:hypothetical protein n=1 Tax=Allobranchiibius sp. CTAmp26 TaxID=2815214 RepID=UPI001AA18E31|nr:hypothetical protein [Allobranchiibius sp. CTAmp26]MBO1754014.1 hypothetical protein [Allobranchiibius sp. CTAmp26]